MSLTSPLLKSLAIFLLPEEILDLVVLGSDWHILGGVTTTPPPM
jgi:hypothetical protein